MPEAAAEASPPSSDTTLARAVEDFQRRLILQRLGECNANWSEAARRLGLDRGNLHRLA
ncbi:helix-turn-helix domain-containing protein, partial [Methylogaea oryzae]